MVHEIKKIEIKALVYVISLFLANLQNDKVWRLISPLGRSFSSFQSLQYHLWPSHSFRQNLDGLIYLPVSKLGTSFNELSLFSLKSAQDFQFPFGNSQACI